MINALMYRDPEVRKEYKLLSIQAALKPDDVDGHIDLIQEMLRSNKVEGELDHLTTGAKTALAMEAVNHK